MVMTEACERAPVGLDGASHPSAGGLVRDIRFDIRHRKSFPRIAVMGDRPMHKWLATH